MPSIKLVSEMLVIGAVATVWVCLFAGRLGLVDFPGLVHNVRSSGFASWLPVVAPLLWALIYQLGWVVYAIFQSFLVKFLRKPLRDPFFPKSGPTYKQVRAVVFQHATENARREVDQDRSIIRLAGAGVLNFTLISVGCLLPMVWGMNWRWAIFAAVCAIASGWTVRHYYKRYHENLVETYRTIRPAGISCAEESDKDPQ